MSEFCELISIDVHSDGDCEAAGIIAWLAESGKAGRFVHSIDCGAKPWESLCALEDALIDTRQNKGWTFIAGQLPGDPEAHGWMEYQGWIVLPYGEEGRRSGSEIGVWSKEDFAELEPVILATAPAADDSGIIINRQLKLMEEINSILGE